jgi:hypothetical protein
MHSFTNSKVDPTGDFDLRSSDRMAGSRSLEDIGYCETNPPHVDSGRPVWLL